MPIEFRCAQCGKLLRTGDDTVGRQAQCPACGSLTQVPAADGPTGEPPRLASLGAEGSAPSGTAPGCPFGVAPGSGGATGSENPYQSPGDYAYGVLPGQPDPFAAQRVSAPATALIVMAILSICLQAFVIVVNLIQVAVGAGMVHRGPEMFPVAFGAGINLFFGILGLAISALVLIGATRMKRLESYSLAVSAAIVAVVPCISPCCLLGLPFGVWALVVLNDPSVKAAFRS